MRFLVRLLFSRHCAFSTTFSSKVLHSRGAPPNDPSSSSLSHLRMEEQSVFDDDSFERSYTCIFQQLIYCRCNRRIGTFKLLFNLRKKSVLMRFHRLSRLRNSSNPIPAARALFFRARRCRLLLLLLLRASKIPVQRGTLPFPEFQGSPSPPSRLSCPEGGPILYLHPG